MNETVLFACRYDSVVDVNGVFRGYEELVAKLSDVAVRGSSNHVDFGMDSIFVSE